MTRKVALITGASGHIGSHLLSHLISNDWDVVSFARNFPLDAAGIAPPEQAKATCVQGDIRDAELLTRTLKEYQPSHLVHLAAQPIVGSALEDSAATFDINVRGTWTLMEAARRYGQAESVIVASSDKAYGTHDSLPYKESFPLRAQNPYDVSKLAAEQIAMSYHHAHALPVCITRCGNTFGAYDLNMSRIVPGTITACLQNADVILRGPGTDERCYVYGKDVARAYLSLMQAPAARVAGEAFNIGSALPISTLGMATLISRTIDGCTSNIVVKNTARCEIARQFLDCQKIKDVTGWTPVTDLQKAMEDSVDWYRGALPALIQTGICVNE